MKQAPPYAPHASRMPMPTRSNRRRALVAAAGTALAVWTAGCAGSRGELPSARLSVEPSGAMAAHAGGAPGPLSAQGTAGLLRTAQAQYASGQLAEAKASLRSARAADPLHPASYDLEARIALDQGDHVGHVTALKAALAANPQSAEVQHTFGEKLIRAGEWAGGIQALKTAVRLAPQSSDYAQDLAAAYFQKGVLAAAEETLAEAAQRMPNDRELPVAMARLHESAGSWKLAARHYGAALRAEPSNLTWHRHYARCLYLAGDYPNAAQAFAGFVGQQGIAASPAEHVQYADACLQLEDYGRALSILDATARQLPERSKDVELLRGLCQLKQGDTEAAKQTIDGALEVWPDDHDLSQLLVLCSAVEEDRGTVETTAAAVGQ